MVLTMQDFTSAPIEEAFTLRGHTYKLHPNLDVMDLADVMGRFQEWSTAYGSGSGSMTREKFVEQKAILGALFVAMLAPGDGAAFAERLDNREINLMREAVPAMSWVMERLGKLLGTSPSSSADGGAPDDETSTDTALPEA